MQHHWVPQSTVIETQIEVDNATRIVGLGHATIYQEVRDAECLTFISYDEFDVSG